MRLLKLILIIASVSWFASCKKCGKKAGNLNEVNHQLTPFKNLHLKGKFDVQLKQDSSFTLKIKGGEGIVEGVNYEFDKDTLIISNHNKCNFLNNYANKVVLEIGIGQIKALEIENPVTLSQCKEINSDSLYINIHDCDVEGGLEGNYHYLNLSMITGTSTFSLSGSAKRFELLERSFGHVYAYNFNTESLSVSSAGTGIIEVRATEYFFARHTGSGIIRYKGQPKQTDILVEENSNAEIIAAE